MQEEIGAKEGELIRRFMPRLNTQIPNEKNWRKFIQKKIDKIMNYTMYLKNMKMKSINMQLKIVCWEEKEVKVYTLLD